MEVVAAVVEAVTVVEKFVELVDTPVAVEEVELAEAPEAGKD